MHTKNKYFSKLVLLTSLTICLSVVEVNAESQSENEAFSAAVKAVKARNYSRALTLFEQQANNTKHDAQYNMAVLLQAGKGRPRNYPDALYWGWLAQLGGIEEAEDIADDVLDALTEDDIQMVRARVGENLQARIDNGDINAIAQFAEYHLTIKDEPDRNIAYIWYSIAVALNVPDMVDRRDNIESDIEVKDLARLQAEARKLFDQYNFAPFTLKQVGGANEG
tara:strand:- start:940 stop:1608 length:669 start_codon:yes stop_codon:yes gene_type:complete